MLHQIARHSVVLARKRSAVISLFFVDLPFLAVRLWLWALLANPNRPNPVPVSGFAVKNGICIVLNVMQFPLISIEVRESFERILKQFAVYRLRFCASDVAPAAPGSAFCTPAPRYRSAAAPSASPLVSPPLLATPPWSGAFAAGGLSGTGCLSGSLGGPLVSGGGGVDIAARLAFEEKEVRRDTVRNTSICAHFWALFLSFLSGLLLATGERFILQGARQISTWVTSWTQSGETL